jgi:hypothetical protein
LRAISDACSNSRGDLGAISDEYAAQSCANSMTAGCFQGSKLNALVDTKDGSASIFAGKSFANFAGTSQ